MAIAAAALLPMLSGPLGCLVVWRRLAYFGDALAHGGLFGIALGTWLSISEHATTFIISIAFAAFMTVLMRRGTLASDTLLGILAHSAMAIGIVSLALLDEPLAHMHEALLGHITSLTSADLMVLAMATLIVWAALYRVWPALVLLCLHEDLARAEGIKRDHMHLLIMVLMSLSVAVGVKLVGVLLMTSFLIIPAATARQFASSPGQMVRLSLLFGLSATLLGLALSLMSALPPGPAMVAISSLQFVLVYLCSGKK